MLERTLTENTSPSLFLRPNSEITVEIVKDAFYKCQFKKAIALVDEELKREEQISKIYKLLMLKSKSYYELNRRDLAKSYLDQSIPQRTSVSHVDYLYAKGSLAYFDGDFENARYFFKQMLESNKDNESSFKALLALGNVCYSEGKKDESLAYLAELNELKRSMELTLELKLSYQIFRATIFLYNEIDVTRAKEILEETFREALEKGWTFFAQRSLYNLAKWFKKTGRKGESQGILKVLDLYLSSSDSRFLAHLVNNEFHETEHRSTQKIEIDRDKKMVSIGNTDKYQMELGRWPLLFKLMDLLATQKGFVSKEKIVEILWPDKVYKPKTFDPRIYDLVSRLKKRLELSLDAQLLIESGENGYKLNMA